MKTGHLKQLMLPLVPHRFKDVTSSPSHAKLVHLGMNFVLTATVGVGYLYGLITPKGRLVETKLLN